MELKDKYKQEFFDLYGSRMFVYLKFTKCETWAKDIIDGKLYMNPIGLYRDIELKSGEKGQGDEQEVKLVSENIQVKLMCDLGEEIPLDTKLVKFHYTDDQYTPTFCMMGLKICDFKVFSYDEEKIILKFPFSIEEIERLKREFGEFIVMIAANEFESAIYNTIEDKKLNGLFKEVIYCDPNFEERQESFFKGSVKRFFYKNENFSYQKEFRLILDEKITEGKFFNVGSLSEFSHMLNIEKLDKVHWKFYYQIETEGI